MWCYHLLIQEPSFDKQHQMQDDQGHGVCFSQATALRLIVPIPKPLSPQKKPDFVLSFHQLFDELLV